MLLLRRETPLLRKLYANGVDGLTNRLKNNNSNMMIIT